MIRNILFAIFLASWAFAFGQIESLPVRVVNGKSYYCYKVPPKATIYSITRTYGISREYLFKYNPQVIDGLRAGDTLLFPCSEEVKESKEKIEEVIEKREEIKDNGEDRKEQREDIKEVADTVVAVEAVEAVEVPVPEDSVVVESERLSIGVMLPFMLDSESVTRQTQNNMAFYRGALLAVSERATEDAGLTIRAYDTEGSIDTLKAIMSKPEIQALDYIIAPGDSVAIEVIAATADTTGGYVVNLFAVKNDSHLRHESVIQGNIPHDAMYAHAIEAYCRLLDGKKVLILNATDIPADKRSFTEELSDAMVKSGIPYEQINYSGKLTAEDLHSLESRNYVCIPTSATREALMKVLPALLELAEANPATGVEMMGYPEWVVLRGEIKEKLHQLNTTVYSRFSTDLDGADVAAVNRQYAKWYGEEPQPSLPDVMLLGYDTISWLLNGSENHYVGLQNSFKIVELDDAGQVNEGLYLINFTRTGRVDARAL